MLNKFIYILGSTGVGKTEFSIEVAQELSWPIVNCDSVQVYQEVFIGTAKPHADEMAKAPHYLFDYVKPPHKQTAADYLKDVKQLIETKKIHQGIFVGGSGFYVQALEKGLYPNSETPEKIKKEVEEWIEKEGFEKIHQWIKEKDPQAAQKISVNDHYRLRRAAQVMKSQNKNLTDLKEEMGKENFSILPPHQSLKVGLHQDKDELRKRIVLRTRKMLEQGFVEEVQELCKNGLGEWAPMMSVGYKEVQEFLAGDLLKSNLEERIVTSTMQLIKKQKTWFRKDPETVWFDVHEKNKALMHIREWAQE